MQLPRFLPPLVASLLAACAGAASADTIGGSLITPSTSLPTVNPYTIDQIADGITSDAAPFNGFASSAASGTITLGLDHAYTLDGFVIWNDINVFHEGIAQFRLDFYDPSQALISSSDVFTAPNGQLAPATYSFDDVANVSRVDLVVLSSNVGVFTRIEIREVALLSAVPEPGGLPLALAGLAGLGWIARRARRAEGSTARLA